MALGSGTYPLRGRTSRALLSDRGARKSTRRPRAGNRMGESSARSGGRRNGTASSGATTPSTIGPEQIKAIQMLGSDIRQVWTAPTTTDRDRKELLRTLLEEVV